MNNLKNDVLKIIDQDGDVSIRIIEKKLRNEPYFLGLDLEDRNSLISNVNLSKKNIYLKNDVFKRGFLYTANRSNFNFFEGSSKFDKFIYCLFITFLISFLLVFYYKSHLFGLFLFSLTLLIYTTRVDINLNDENKSKKILKIGIVFLRLITSYTIIDVIVNFEFVHDKIIDNKIAFKKSDIMILTSACYITFILNLSLKDILSTIFLCWGSVFCVLLLYNIYIDYDTYQVHELVFQTLLWTSLLIPASIFVVKDLIKENKLYLFLSALASLIFAYSIFFNYERLRTDYYLLSLNSNNGYCSNIIDEQKIILNSKNPSKVVLEYKNIKENFLKDVNLEMSEKEIKKYKNQRFFYYECK